MHQLDVTPSRVSEAFYALVEQFWFVCRKVNRYAYTHATDFVFPPDSLKPV
jgi:hypothetical protein